MNHYVYLLEDRAPTTDKKYYIGVRSCRCKIGEDPYLGSSTIMTEDEKSRCNKIILKRFSTRESAIGYEIYLHELFDVGNNPTFYNMVKQKSVGFDMPSTMQNKAIMEKRAKSISKALTGKKLSEETKIKIGLKQKGNTNMLGKTHSERTKAKISKSKQGQKHTMEARSKISASKYKPVLCLETQITYKSAQEAAKAINLKYQAHIGSVCNGKRKTAGGFTWQWAHIEGANDE